MAREAGRFCIFRYTAPPARTSPTIPFKNHLHWYFRDGVLEQDSVQDVEGLAEQWKSIGEEAPGVVEAADSSDERAGSVGEAAETEVETNDDGENGSVVEDRDEKDPAQDA